MALTLIYSDYFRMWGALSAWLFYSNKPENLYSLFSCWNTCHIKSETYHNNVKPFFTNFNMLNNKSLEGKAFGHLKKTPEKNVKPGFMRAKSNHLMCLCYSYKVDI